MRRPGNILLLAILIGALASALVYRHLKSQEQALQEALLHAQKPAEVAAPATMSIVVAKDTIPIGTTIEPGQVKVIPWPVEAPVEGAFSDPGAVKGIARMRIEKNQPVTQDQLVSANAGLLPLLINEGMRGMSVKVDNVTGVSGFITPDSRVDVLIAGSPGTGNIDRRGKVVLQNIRVLASGTTIERKDNKPVEVPTVTLLVSPEDAEKLTLATRDHGPVQLALRNFRDEVLIKTTGATDAALFGRASEPPGPPPVIGERHQEGPRGYSVQILLGNKVTRQGVS
jgi:pilus assembly protein CpaB